MEQGGRPVDLVHESAAKAIDPFNQPQGPAKQWDRLGLTGKPQHLTF